MLADLFWFSELVLIYCFYNENRIKAIVKCCNCPIKLSRMWFTAESHPVIRSSSWKCVQLNTGSVCVLLLGVYFKSHLSASLRHCLYLASSFHGNCIRVVDKASLRAAERTAAAEHVSCFYYGSARQSASYFFRTFIT